MRTHLKAKCLWTIVLNGFEERNNDGEFTAAEMKNLEAKYCQDTKMKNLEAKYRQDANSLRKIQMGVLRAYFAKIANFETAKQARESLEIELYGEEMTRTINLQILRREFQNIKMIEIEKRDKYYTRIVHIVNEMRNHGYIISYKQVVEKIQTTVNETYEYIVAIIEEMKDLFKYSMKELVGSFHACKKQRYFFMKINLKKLLSRPEKNENSKNFSKNQLKKNYNPKRKQDHDDSFKKVEEKGEKNTSIFL